MERILEKPIILAGRIFPTGETIDCTDEALAVGEKAYAKQVLRTEIQQQAGDTLSLLGTTSDAAQVLVLFACADAVALAQAKDFAGYQKARMDSLAALSGGAEGAANMVQMAGKLLTDVQSGAVIMPFLVKPEKATGVFADVAARGTGVAQVLAKASA